MLSFLVLFLLLSIMSEFHEGRLNRTSKIVLSLSTPQGLNQATLPVGTAYRAGWSPGAQTVCGVEVKKSNEPGLKFQLHHRLTSFSEFWYFFL